MIITHNGTILKHDGTILTKITEVPPQPPFTNTYSLDFDGVDDYVSTNSKIIASDITLSGWVNFNGSYSNFSAHFPMSITPSNTSVPNETLGRFYKDGSTLQIAIQCNDNTGANFSTYYVDNTTLEGAGWQHVCLTYNVTTKHIYAYLNGVAQNWVKIFAASTPVPFLTAVGTRIYESDLTIGRVQPATSTGNYLGLVDEVSTYNRILTQPEITALYNSGTPTDLTSLSPVAWYRMGDNGSYKSPQWLLPSNENKDKVSNYSFQLDGVDDYIDLGNDSSLDIFGSDFTISLWAKWGAQTTNSNGLINFAANTNKAVVALGFGTQYGKISFGNGNSSTVGILYDCGSGYDDNNWHHIMCTLQGSTRTIYVDGVDISSTGSGSSIAVGSNNDIGNRARSRYFVGNIDDVSIFDSVIPIGNVWDGSGQPTTLPSGAVAHYKMGEEANFTSNWLVDNSALSNYSKRSFEFDGVDDKIELGTQSLGLTGAISVSAWVKIPTTNTGGGGTNIQEIVCEDRTSGTNRNWALYWRGGGLNQISGVIWDSAGSAVAATTTAIVPNDNQWHHVMFTYTGDTSTDGLKLFVDGIQRAQGTSANGGTRSTTAVVPTIGGLSNVISWMFEGNIDEVSIFNTDQSANVSTIYNSGIPNDLTELSPLHWYRMGEDASFDGTNWTVPDNVGSNDGTSDGMMVDALVGEAPNYSGGGISNAMTIQDRVGDAPNSTDNSLSYNMDLVDRVEDTP